MNKGIAVVGNLTVDRIKLCDNIPSPRNLTSIRNSFTSIGGCVANIASDIAKIDSSMNVVAIGKVGSDADGEFIKNSLSSFGVDVERIVSVEEISTSYTDVMIDALTKESVFFYQSGANSLFAIEDIDFTKLDVDIFHIGDALILDEFDKADEEYGTAMAYTLYKASELGIKTSIGVSEKVGENVLEVVAPCLKHCDYLIINEDEASALTNMSVRDENGKISQSAIKTAINCLFEQGVREVVCIHSSEGGWYSQKGNGIYYQPSLNVSLDMVKSRVGVGDAFCAAILYSLYHEFDPEYSLRVAGAAACCTLSEINSTDGIRSFDKMMELESEIGYEM